MKTLTARKMLLFVASAATSFWAPDALSCVSDATEPKLQNYCCSTLGETVLSDTKTNILACVLEAPSSSARAWTPMTGAPAKAITAFNSVSCPVGWTEATFMHGRAIVGSGSGVGLTNRPFGTFFGEESHIMTISELVSHAHTIGARWSDSGAFSAPVKQDATRFAAGGINTILSDRTTATEGLGQPFNVMQPSVALTFCQKEE